MRNIDKILIGTNNEKKLGQFRNIFGDLRLDIELISLKDIGISDDVEENEDSLLENAKNKARFYGEKSGMLTLSDDTGLFIDALNGEPGIHAKRWHDGTERDRCFKILERMKDIPKEKRTCRYIGVLAVFNPQDKKFWTYEGQVEGRIADKLLEAGGFGYDSIFISTFFNKYYSQLTEKEKHSISHRGMGVRKFVSVWKNR
jgi:XTP/dITP diphosphohydrolase